MRTLETLVKQTVNHAVMGDVVDLNNALKSIQMNQINPYISGPEDMRVLLECADLLRDSQPLEFNGFKILQLLNSASKQIMINPRATYSKVVTDHPSLLSFPSEVVWLAIPEGVKYFKQNIEWVLQRDNIGFDQSKATKIADTYSTLIKTNYQNYNFWTAITQKYESEVLSRLLIELCIEMANQGKMRFLSGIVPIINSKTLNSIKISHVMNLAYGNVIEDTVNKGFSAPKYFYTLNLNSSMVLDDQYTDGLKEIVGYTRQAMQTNMFDGIYLSVRGLDNISNSSGRVSTLSKLITELSSIAHEEKVPLWLSRFGLIGLAGFDMGASFASYRLNMDIKDVFTNSKGGFKKTNDKQLHGKVLNPHMRQFLDANQVEKLPKGLPEMTGVCNVPIPRYLEKSTPYRIEFSKPYNIAAMQHLNEEWFVNTLKGEYNPGAEYLKKFDSPSFYHTWGND